MDKKIYRVRLKYPKDKGGHVFYGCDKPYIWAWDSDMDLTYMTKDEALALKKKALAMRDPMASWSEWKPEWVKVVRVKNASR